MQWTKPIFLVVAILLAALLAPQSALAQTYATHDDEQLAAYIDEALERNPALRESFARHRAALQRLPQVSALPDPQFDITQYVRSPETRVGPQTTLLSISQRFPWFGKLSDREGIAAKQAAVLQERHRAGQAETVRRVKLAYYDLAYIDRALAITQEDLELLRHYETLAEARYAQGVGSQQAAVKLQAEITRGLSRLQTLGRQRVDAEAVLNALRDRSSADPLPKVELPEIPPTAVEWDDLIVAAREQRPELQAAFLEIETEEKRIQAARREGRPDFELGAGFINVNRRGDPAGLLMPPPDNGKNAFRFSVGVNLPISRRKYDAAVLEATEQFVASKAGYRYQVNQVQASIRSLGFRIETLLRQISLFEKALLPQSEQALRVGEVAYASGTAGVLELLDSERVLLEVRLGLAQLRSDYVKALAEMERAVGSAFPPVGSKFPPVGSKFPPVGSKFPPVGSRFKEVQP